MTHIVSTSRYPSKKAFREAVAAKAGAVYCDDPSIFNPCSGTVAEILSSRANFTVTNHPKRSWFASVAKARDGTIKVS